MFLVGMALQQDYATSRMIGGCICDIGFYLNKFDKGDTNKTDFL
jgi:hypothetical protein